MKKVLLTGMSGTGKSTLADALTTRGYKANDADSDEWCEWVQVSTSDETEAGNCPLLLAPRSSTIAVR